MTYQEILSLFHQTAFVVEATATEHQFLWEKYSNQAIYKTPFNTLTWEGASFCPIFQVGEIEGHPINVCLRFDRINNFLILFYDCISNWVCYSLVEEWIRERCSPRWDKGTRLAHTNAMNFHHVFDYINNPESR